MEDADEMGTKVELYVYDLTKGMAAMMSHMLIGIWHVTRLQNIFENETEFQKNIYVTKHLLFNIDEKNNSVWAYLRK